MSPTGPHGQLAVDDLAESAEFWVQELRLGRYFELQRQIDDPGYRRERVRVWFRSRRALRFVAARLGLSQSGTVAELQARLVRVGRPLLPFLAVAAYASRKAPVAVLDVAQSVLSQEQLERARRRDGRFSGLLLLLQVFEKCPAALAHVRGLQAWHRQSGALVRLDHMPARCEGFEAFLTREAVERAVAGVALPRGVPGVRHEMTINRQNDGVLVILSRNLRRTHSWTDDGKVLQHGHTEELVVLQFLDGGRRAWVSGKTAALPRSLASAIASAWFHQECQFVDDVQPSEPASLDRLISALLLGEVDGVRLVEVAVRVAPLVGSPEVVLRTSSPSGDVSAALHDFESRVGPLLDRLEDVRHVKLSFRGRVVEVDFPLLDGRPVARFADHRLDRHTAREFREFLASEFGLALHTMEALCA